MGFEPTGRRRPAVFETATINQTLSTLLDLAEGEGLEPSRGIHPSPLAVERISQFCHPSLSGAQGRTRTYTRFPSLRFERSASSIPPLGRWCGEQGSNLHGVSTTRA